MKIQPNVTLLILSLFSSCLSATQASCETGAERVVVAGKNSNKCLKQTAAGDEECFEAIETESLGYIESVEEPGRVRRGRQRRELMSCSKCLQRGGWYFCLFTRHCKRRELYGGYWSRGNDWGGDWQVDWQGKDDTDWHEGWRDKFGHWHGKDDVPEDVLVEDSVEESDVHEDAPVETAPTEESAEETDGPVDEVQAETTPKEDSVEESDVPDDIPAETPPTEESIEVGDVPEDVETDTTPTEHKDLFAGAETKGNEPELAAASTSVGDDSIDDPCWQPMGPVVDMAFADMMKDDLGELYEEVNVLQFEVQICIC